MAKFVTTKRRVYQQQHGSDQYVDDAIQAADKPNEHLYSSSSDITFRRVG